MDARERTWATYELKPVDHLIRREFYIWGEAYERWKKEGMPAGADYDYNRLFGFDPGGVVSICRLGWCEPAFCPAIKPTVLETGDDYEIVRDEAGRVVRFFKGRRHGFMPTYLKHAVTCEKDWQEGVLPLLNPKTPQRWEGADKEIETLKDASRDNYMVSLNGIGAYMYLRALVGPEEICYMFVDDPGLIHKMMQAWLDLADAVSAFFQKYVAIDKIFFGEDICYNHGLLISPDMVRRFIFPYYRQLVININSRQARPLKFFEVDTDGNCDEVIDLYREVGMNVMSPFEVAAGNDVVAIARKYPDLVMSGGIDKRVLADGPEAIDNYLGKVIPFMVKRGGYIPTCDHGVPDNVSYASYMHYRKRIMELDH
ncbi:MAG: hypothetical protein HZA50_01100 [Planctomycetes bacterium]|nr:hypothetical protein [Planctomycetota bacterium]